MRQAYSNSPRLVNFHSSSPELSADSRIALGSSCSIFGNFFINSACFRFSIYVANTNSWYSDPSLKSRNRICSPSRTSIEGGSNNIRLPSSNMDTFTVRDFRVRAPERGSLARTLNLPMQPPRPGTAPLISMPMHEKMRQWTNQHQWKQHECTN